MKHKRWEKSLRQTYFPAENAFPAQSSGRKASRARKGVCIGLALLVLTGLTACGSTAETPLPDLSALGEMTVIAREEGSGTRAEFETLVGTDEEGVNATALSTEQVLEMVGSDQNAIGYLAYSAIDTDDEDGVKVLMVDGTACTADAIENGDYTLRREYILAYSGELSDLETDFIRYVRSAGQTIVSQACIPVSGITTYLSDGLSGTITIAGSSSMETLMEALIEDYLVRNPKATIELTISDSTEGLNAAMRGECDLAMSSRSLKDYEKELLEYRAIAVDGLAVIVNEANPLTDISLTRLQSIYDGDVSEWNDLR